MADGPPDEQQRVDTVSSFLEVVPGEFEPIELCTPARLRVAADSKTLQVHALISEARRLHTGQPALSGYGLLLAVGHQGKQFTAATADVDLVRALAAAGHEALTDLHIPTSVARTTFMVRDGWPEDWT